MTHLRRRDQVEIFFKDETSAPYRMHGKIVAIDDDEITIEGTVGEYIGKKYVIPRNEIKMIGILEPVSNKRQSYDDFWGDTPEDTRDL